MFVQFLVLLLCIGVLLARDWDPRKLVEGLMSELNLGLKQGDDLGSLVKLFSPQVAIIQIGEYCQCPSACCAAYPDPTIFLNQQAGLQSHWDLSEIAINRDSDIRVMGSVWFHYPAPYLKTAASNFTILWTRKRNRSYKIAGLTLVSVGCQLSDSNPCTLCDSILNQCA